MDNGDVRAEIWIRRLRRDYVKREFPEAARSLVERALSTPALLRAVRDDRELLLGALLEAAADGTQLLGAEIETWRWGKLHVANFRHGLDRRACGAATSPCLFDRGPIERPGDSDTVNATGSHGESFEQAYGASYREVLDLADWDRSRVINVPGESGEPTSAHYGDLLPPWAAGDYFPLVFSRPAVEAAAGERLELLP